MSYITVDHLPTHDLLHGKAVSISLDIDGDDCEFGRICATVPLPSDGKLVRTQVHKALEKSFRRMLDDEFQNEEFLINGYTDVSTLAPDETGAGLDYEDNLV